MLTESRTQASCALQMPIIHCNLFREIHSQCHLAKQQSVLFKSVLDEVGKDVTVTIEELGLLQGRRSRETLSRIAVVRLAP